MAAGTPRPVILFPKAPESLAERFWSIARGKDGESESDDPVAVVQHVLAVLDALDQGEVGDGVTVNTMSFLALLRQQEVKGDLLYASPEQARGEQMDERSLVFSAGVLLFEKLTGRHPFGVEGNPNRLARIRKGEIASGVNYFPKIPTHLRHILMKAMGPFPEERWSTLRELREELEAFVRHATLPGVSEPRRRPLPGYDDAPTRVVPRPRRPPTPGPSSKIIVDEKPTPAPASSTAQMAVPAPNLLSGPRFGKATPFVWMGIGAAVASLLFLLLTSGSGQPEAAASGAGDEKAKASVEKAGAPARAVADDTRLPAPTVAPPAAAGDPEAEAAPEVPAVFDPDFGGETALAAARECFDEGRLRGGVNLGISLVYGKVDGLSRKVFFGAGGAEPAERRCLMDKLKGLSAGAPPERNVVVEYSLFLNAADGTVRARVKE